MHDSFVHLLEDVSTRMMSAISFHDRWRVMNETLRSLGADAVNITEISPVTGLPFWFFSSLGPEILNSYISEGHNENDYLVEHASRHSGSLVWQPGDVLQAHHRGQSEQTRPSVLTFANFVKDSGYRVLVSNTLASPDGISMRNVTYCSKLSAAEALQSGNQRKIQLTLNILLPWVQPPDHRDGPEFRASTAPALSRREVEALCFLANGYMTARIAEAMNIAEVTVDKHLGSAKLKLGAQTRAQAVAIAIRERLLPL